MIDGVRATGGGGLQELLRSLQKDEMESLEEQVAGGAAVQQLAGEIPILEQAGSIMSRNFVSANTGESRYLAAAKNTLALKSRMAAQQTGRVNALLESLGGIQLPRPYDGGGSKAPANKAYIQQAMTRIKNTEAQEASERNLDELKKNVEQKAQEAAVPKDENGEPIYIMPESGGVAPAPMPAPSAPAPLPAPEVGSAPAASAPVDVSDSAPAKAAPSIRIVV
ncbi:hypothetical protein LJC48_00830 [Desulfovibrio sp. OttesenSCG-928-C06]|nr:hypothetical protein [Desulfovibrio sp. OttesenSCG-928-C06]